MILRIKSFGTEKRQNGTGKSDMTGVGQDGLGRGWGTGSRSVARVSDPRPSVDRGRAEKHVTIGLVTWMDAGEVAGVPVTPAWQWLPEQETNGGEET